MEISSKLKKVIMTVAAVTLIVAVYLIHALGGIGARTVEFAAPPEFVARYATQHESKATPAAGKTAHASADHPSDIGKVKMTTDYAEEEALVMRVFFEDESPEKMLELFAHPDLSQRVRIASAFGHVNIKYTHNEESGFPDKRRQFWDDMTEHMPDIENALFEALIVSAQEGTNNYLPYTLAWMPGQDEDTVEMFAWAANHHPAPWVRRFSVYFIIAFSGNEALASEMMDLGIHDPAYIVRKQVFDLRLQKITG